MTDCVCSLIIQVVALPRVCSIWNLKVRREEKQLSSNETPTFLTKVYLSMYISKAIKQEYVLFYSQVLQLLVFPRCLTPTLPRARGNSKFNTPISKFSVVISQKSNNNRTSKTKTNGNRFEKSSLKLF